MREAARGGDSLLVSALSIFNELRHTRPDLLALGAEATVILDFKTGQPAPAHSAQVARYLTLARELPGRAGIPLSPPGPSFTPSIWCSWI